MKGIDTGKDKVKKICDVLKRETLEPAKKEAEEIIEAAKQKAAHIIHEAKVEAEKILDTTKKDLEKHKSVFQSSLNQACKQTVELLKQQVENQLFDPELSALLQKPLEDPKVVAELVSAVVEALSKEGVDAQLSAVVPKSVTPQAINQLLLQGIVEKLKGGSVELGNMRGGVFVRSAQESLSIDVTDSALKELVSDYIRKDFREILFRS